METQTKNRTKIQTPEEAIKYINSEGYKMSFSQLSQFKESPRHLIRYLTGETEFGAPALFSRKAHVYKLEGLEAFHEKYLVVGDPKQPISKQEKAFDNCMVNDFDEGGLKNKEHY